MSVEPDQVLVRSAQRARQRQAWRTSATSWPWTKPASTGRKSSEIAAEVARLNADLMAEGVPYVLIGLGRWGSADPWLGIPVTWEQISGARVIVESGLKDINVTPSQGSHFFQNLTSFRVGYFTVNPEDGEGDLDWDWLAAQPAAYEGAYVRHLRFAEPLVVAINGKRQRGVILKPEPVRPPSGIE